MQQLEEAEAGFISDESEPPLVTTSGRARQARSHAKPTTFSVDQDIDLSSSGLLDLVSDSKDSQSEVIEDDDEPEDTSGLSKTMKQKRRLCSEDRGPAR